MEKYIGIGFIILYLPFLIFVTGIISYSIRLTKKELDVKTARTHKVQTKTMRKGFY